MGSDFVCLNSNITNSVALAGCAFIKFETKEQALAAIEALNGKHKMEVCASFAVSFGYMYNSSLSTNTPTSKNKMKQNKSSNLKSRTIMTYESMRISLISCDIISFIQGWFVLLWLFAQIYGVILSLAEFIHLLLTSKSCYLIKEIKFLGNTLNLCIYVIFIWFSQAYAGNLGTHFFLHYNLYYLLGDCFGYIGLSELVLSIIWTFQVK